MSVDGGPEYPVTTDLAEAPTGSLALAEEPNEPWVAGH